MTNGTNECYLYFSGGAETINRTVYHFQVTVLLFLTHSQDDAPVTVCSQRVADKFLCLGTKQVDVLSNHCIHAYIHAAYSLRWWKAGPAGEN